MLRHTDLWSELKNVAVTHNTFITEQGIASGVSFVQEVMKDKHEDDLIFKKLDIPWLSNQDSIMHGEVHMDSKVEKL